MKHKKKSFRGRVGRNIEKKERESKGRSYLSLPKGIKMFKPEKGSVKFDIIPYIVTDELHLDRDEETGDATAGDTWWKKPFKVHKSVGVENETVICPKTFKKPCPICEYAKKLNDDGEDWDDIKEIFAKDRSLYVVHIVDDSKFDEEYENDLYVFDMSYHMFEKQLNEELDVDEENEVFPNVEGGKTLDVRFREKKFGKSKYYEAAVIKFEDREGKEKDYSDDVPNLDEVFKLLTYKELEALFFENEDPNNTEEDNRDFDEVDKHKDRKKKKNKKKKEKEEPKPTQSKKPTRSPKKESGKEKCPHGHKFGVDGDEKDECKDCKKWDACTEG